MTTPPYMADIGDGQETFETLADVQRAMRARVSGIRSGDEWYAQMRSRHGTKIRSAVGTVVASVSYNGRLWRPSGAREEIVVEQRWTASRDSVNELRIPAARRLDPDPAAEVDAVARMRIGRPQVAQHAPAGEVDREHIRARVAHRAFGPWLAGLERHVVELAASAAREQLKIAVGSVRASSAVDPRRSRSLRMGRIQSVRGLNGGTARRLYRGRVRNPRPGIPS